MAEPTELVALRRTAIEQLRSASIENAEIDVDLLLAQVLHCDRLGLLRRSHDIVGTDDVTHFLQLLESRGAGRPVSRILGRREFWSLNFEVTDAVLDPRSDSETLVEAILRRRTDRDRALRILDLGSGSGCLLLALLSEFPNASGLGIDKSPLSVDVARRNANRLGLDDRSTFRVLDWSAGIQDRFDVMVANPPYIPSAEILGLAAEVRLHDPTPALDGGADGLDAYRQLVPLLPGLLVTQGIAAFECGIGQSASVQALISESGHGAAEIERDLSGIERCLVVDLAVKN